LTKPSPPGLAVRSNLSQQDRLDFARRLIVLPVALFLALAVLYPALVLLVLVLPTPLGLVVSPVCGVLIGMLFIVGHDACHNGFTASTALNHIIGRIAFLPSLHSFSTWARGHNGMHHGYNNVRGIDAVWEPCSPDDYRARGTLRRLMYRFYRTPVGVGFYYMIELWAPYHAWSVPVIYRDPRPIDVLDTLLVILFLVVQAWVVITVGGALGHGAVASLSIGLIIPFLTWNWLMSLIIFLHHTHPAVPWFASVAAWRTGRGSVTGAAHVRFPWPFGLMLLSIMEHNAHHSAPAVPFYNLKRMQQAMAAGDDFLSWQFSWRGLARVCSRCKLYDYELGRWVLFGEAERIREASGITRLDGQPRRIEPAAQI
jgi:omega-6 fatty acid desaturase (delta-12 desaturase)